MAEDTIFSNEELSSFVWQIRSRKQHCIEIACGCTTRKNGDSMGVLKIYDNGTIYATCHCSPNCNKEFTSPFEFAKHASRTLEAPNWRTKLWVLNWDGEKIKLEETCFLKYYKGDQYYKRPYSEFLRCSACKKIRRFEIQSKETFKVYNEAALREYRTCSDMKPGQWACEKLEERSSRKRRRDAKA